MTKKLIHQTKKVGTRVIKSVDKLGNRIVKVIPVDYSKKQTKKLKRSFT